MAQSSPSHSTRYSLTRLTGTILALVGLLGFVVLSVAVTHHACTGLDVDALTWIHQDYTPSGGHVAALVSKITEPVLMVALGLVLAGVLWVRRARRQGAALAASSFGSGVLTFVLKDLFHQARPHLFDGPIVEHGYGYPSGHALVSMGLLMFVLLLWRERLRHAGSRALLLGAGLLVVFGIGFDRLYLGVHWLTDVAGGYLIGLFWLMTCWLTYSYRQIRARLASRS